MEKTPVDKNEQLVIAYFADRVAAEHAIEAVKDWDAANTAVKLGGVGILAKENGKIKTSQVGRKTGKGAAVGAAVGILGGLLTGGLGLIAAAVGGTLVGSGLGALFKQSLDLSEEDLKAIDAELDSGKVAVVVTCDAYEVDGVVADLRQHGAATLQYRLAAGALEETQAATEQALAAYQRSQDATANATRAAMDAAMSQTSAAIEGASTAPAQLRGDFAA